MLQGGVQVLGMDANETFRPPLAGRPGCYASTGRGELILEWMLSLNIKLPPQDLATPTYHPYNPTRAECGCGGCDHTCAPVEWHQAGFPGLT